MRTLLASLLLLSGCSAGSVLFTYKETKTTVLTTAAISSTQYTGWIPVAQYAGLTLEITYTNSNATAVVMACKTSDSAATANGSGFSLQKLTDSATAGRYDSNNVSWSQAVSGDESWSWSVGVLPHDYINCSFDGTGADGNDKVTVSYKQVTP